MLKPTYFISYFKGNRVSLKKQTGPVFGICTKPINDHWIRIKSPEEFKQTMEGICAGFDWTWVFMYIAPYDDPNHYRDAFNWLCMFIPQEFKLEDGGFYFLPIRDAINKLAAAEVQLRA